MFSDKPRKNTKYFEVMINDKSQPIELGQIPKEHSLRKCLLSVAVAAIFDKKKESILLSYRPEGQKQGGAWELPGGKVENDETIDSALKRELKEELGIFSVDIEPIKDIYYVYDDQELVKLSIWHLIKFSNVITNNEGQKLSWFYIRDLQATVISKANRLAIKSALAWVGKTHG